MSPVIVVDQLTKWYGARLAVDRVSLEVRAGEVLGLLGPNGSGKTTILRILTGYLRPSSGTVSVAGLDISDAALSGWGLPPLARQDAGGGRPAPHPPRGPPAGGSSAAGGRGGPWPGGGGPGRPRARAQPPRPGRGLRRVRPRHAVPARSFRLP